MNTISEIQVSYHPKCSVMSLIKSCHGAYEVIIPLFNEDMLQYKEIFMVLYHNRANWISGYHEHLIGSDASNVASAKRVIVIVFKVNTFSFILVHNHPTRSTKPSSADIDITKRIKEAAGLFEIKVLDHLIIGEGFYSFT